MPRQRNNTDQQTQPVWQTHQGRQQGMISLAELLIVAEDLPWQDKDQLREILHTLGFAPADEKKTQPLEPARGVSPTPQSNRIKKRTPEQPHYTAPPAPELPIDLSDQAVLLQHELKARDNHDDQAPPDWLTQTDEANPYQPLLSAHNEQAPLPRKSLFPDNTSRGLLSAALATKRRGSEVDIPHVIDSIVRGKLLQSLPYRSTSTLDQGCQLLLDYSSNMAPYREDLHSLIRQLHNVAGSNSVPIYDFDGSPLQARRWISRKKSIEWQTEPATPVLVASDFGISTASQSLLSHPDWPAFIETCKAAGVPLIVLTPLGKDNWPQNIGTYPLLIHWHPNTTATMVRQLIGAGHEVSA